MNNLYKIKTKHYGKFFVIAESTVDAIETFKESLQKNLTLKMLLLKPFLIMIKLQ
jgi:hypothetical protein